MKIRDAHSKLQVSLSTSVRCLEEIIDKVHASHTINVKVGEVSGGQDILLEDELCMLLLELTGIYRKMDEYKSKLGLSGEEL